MLEFIGGLAELFLEPFVEIFGQDILKCFARQLGRRQILGLTFLGKRLS
jgi:hypothetical protein